jgi:hypothetical protein
MKLSALCSCRGLGNNAIVHTYRTSTLNSTSHSTHASTCLAVIQWPMSGSPPLADKRN